jgi:hypothetical protein
MYRGLFVDFFGLPFALSKAGVTFIHGTSPNLLLLLKYGVIVSAKGYGQNTLTFGTP